MKGRGTRIFDFTECWISKNDIPEIYNQEKLEYLLERLCRAVEGIDK